MIFGWIFVGHQLGAASIALAAGILRATLGTYAVPVTISGGLCLLAAFGVQFIGRKPRAAEGRGKSAAAADA